jgi:hypothetical protein
MSGEPPRALTPAARANLASGATSGPGTARCANCGGDKEPTRLNSRTCRACSAGGGVTIADLLVRLDAQAEAIRDLRKRVADLERTSAQDG